VGIYCAAMLDVAHFDVRPVDVGLLLLRIEKTGTL